MTSHDFKTTSYLTYAGASPFVIALFLPGFSGWIGGEVNLEINAKVVFISYSVAIASFMAGTLWGRLHGVVLQSDFVHVGNHQQILWLSNLLCLCPWIAGLLALAGYFSIGLIILLLVYVVLYVYERQQWRIQAGSYNDAYLSLRFKVTAVVTILHLLALGRFS